MAKPVGYSRAQISLHWVIAILIGLQFAFHERIEQASQALSNGLQPADSSHMGHVIGGIVILALVVWRLLLRRSRGAPDLPPEGNPILDALAKWTHWLLYALMLLVPLSGMASWFGKIEIAGELHGMFFGALGLLVLLHVAGAIYHQYVKKDGLIRRMMKAE